MPKMKERTKQYIIIVARLISEGKTAKHNNSDPGIVNISGDERDLLTSVCHDPFPGVIGVE